MILVTVGGGGGGLYRSQESRRRDRTRSAICVAGCTAATRNLCAYQGSATSRVKGAHIIKKSRLIEESSRQTRLLRHKCQERFMAA